jgi:hypothetical protein
VKVGHATHNHGIAQAAVEQWLYQHAIGLCRDCRSADR